MKKSFPSFSASCEYISLLLKEGKQARHWRNNQGNWIVEARDSTEE